MKYILSLFILFSLALVPANFVYAAAPATPTPCPANATSSDCILGQIQPPAQVVGLGFGSAGISNVVNKFITLIYIAAAVIFVFFVVFSGFEWIMSGGDKEKVEAARQRLTYAIIGVVILALAFVLINLLGQITNFKFFS